MVISQKFNVVPSGVIQSGTCEFVTNTLTGEIDTDESIIGGVWIFTKTIQESGVLKVDPSLLLSKNIKIGMKLQAGTFAVTVVSVVNNHATLQINVSDPVNQISLSGSGDLDLEGEYWEVTTVILTGQVQGNDVTVELQPTH